VRRQRVLAILAIKELEAQQIERGQVLAGPLATFAFQVDLADVRLHRVGARRCSALACVEWRGGGLPGALLVRERGKGAARAASAPAARPAVAHP
jgi:hypothetical protein